MSPVLSFLAFDAQAFMIYLVLCFCRLFSLLKLQLELPLKDLQSLVLQVKLLHLGDLFECVCLNRTHSVDKEATQKNELDLASQTREMQELCCCPEPLRHL